MSTPLIPMVVLGVVTLLACSAADGRADGAEEAKPATDLVDVLRPTPIARPLERARIRPYGWVEASVSSSPLTESDSRAGRVFDTEAEGFRLHQACFALERTPADGCCFDVGGKVAVMWGTDAALIHARGLFDDQTSEEHFDLVEAHALLRLPLARGLTLKMGKFTTPMGFEVIEAPNDLLVSRSFLFGYAIPYTHTGVLATVQASPRISLSYGVVLGWDVWDDNNPHALSQLVAFGWKSPSERDGIVVNAIVGAERPGNTSDLRYVLDATWTHTWSDRWKIAVNADLGYEEGAAAGEDASWWGVAAYATHTFSDRLSGTVRAEWIRDVDGTRMGTPASLAGLTLGLDWTPWCHLPNLRLRPEVRWDHSFDGPFFDHGRDEDQLSLTLELLFTF